MGPTFRLTILAPGSREGMIHAIPIRDSLDREKTIAVYSALTNQRDAEQAIDLLRPGAASAVTAQCVVAARGEPSAEVKVERIK